MEQVLSSLDASAVSSSASSQRTVPDAVRTLREAARVLNIDVDDDASCAPGLERKTGTALAQAIIDAVKQRVKARQAVTTARTSHTASHSAPSTDSFAAVLRPGASSTSGEGKGGMQATQQGTAHESKAVSAVHASTEQTSNGSDTPDLLPASLSDSSRLGVGTERGGGVALSTASPQRPSTSVTLALAQAAEALYHTSDLAGDSTVALGAQSIAEGIWAALEAAGDGKGGSQLTLGARCIHWLAALLAKEGQKEGSCDGAESERWASRAAACVSKASASIARSHAKSDPAIARAAIAVHAAATRAANKPRQAPTPARPVSASRLPVSDGDQPLAAHQQPAQAQASSPVVPLSTGRGRRRSSITAQVIHLTSKVQMRVNAASPSKRDQMTATTVSEGVQTEEFSIASQEAIDEQVGLRLIGATGRGDTALVVSPKRATVALAAVAASGQFVTIAPPPPPPQPPSSVLVAAAGEEAQAPSPAHIPSHSLGMTRVRLELPRLSLSPSQAGRDGASGRGGGPKESTRRDTGSQPFTLEISEDVFAALVAQAAQKVVEEQSVHAQERGDSAGALRKSVSFADMSDLLRGMGGNGASPANTFPRPAQMPFASPVLTQKGRSILADDGDEEEEALQARRRQVLAVRQGLSKPLAASPTGSTASSTRQMQSTTIRHPARPRSVQPTGTPGKGSRSAVRSGSVQSREERGGDKRGSTDKPRAGVYYQSRPSKATSAPVPVRAATASVLPGHDARSLVRVRMLKAQAVKSKEYQLLKKAAVVPAVSMPLQSSRVTDSDGTSSSSVTASHAPLTASSLASDEDAIQALGATLDGLLKTRGAAAAARAESAVKWEAGAQRVPRLALLPVGLTSRTVSLPRAPSVHPPPVPGPLMKDVPIGSGSSVALEEATDAALAKINSLLGPPPAFNL